MLIDTQTLRNCTTGQIEIIRKSIEIYCSRSIEVILHSRTMCGTFGPSANGTANMAQRNLHITARYGKLGDGRNFRLQRIDAAFKIFDSLGFQRLYPTLAASANGKQRRNGHQLRIDTAGIFGDIAETGVRTQVVAQQSHERHQFVDGTVCLHSNVAFCDTFSADKGCFTLVAGFGIYLHNLKCCFGSLLLNTNR